MGSEQSTQPTVHDEVGPLAEPFDAPRYMGKWYCIQHTYCRFMPDYIYNTTAVYSDWNEETGVFRVENESSVARLLPNIKVGGTASTKGWPNGHAVVELRNSRKPGPNYIVLETDYETYSVVTGGPGGMGLLWILGRTHTLD